MHRILDKISYKMQLRLMELGVITPVCCIIGDGKKVNYSVVNGTFNFGNSIVASKVKGLICNVASNLRKDCYKRNK